MAAKSVTIYMSEMTEFMEQRNDFTRIDLRDGTKEVVFSKAMYWGRYPELADGTLDYQHPIYRQLLSIRVYSTIELNMGRSRGVGDDAIRVSVWLKQPTKEGGSRIFMVGGAKRVHRVENWRHNLQNRLDNWQDCLLPLCPECNAPTFLRTPPRGARWNPFYGCSRYHTDNCKGSVPLGDAKL